MAFMSILVKQFLSNNFSVVVILNFLLGLVSMKTVRKKKNNNWY